MPTGHPNQNPQPRLFAAFVAAGFAALIAVPAPAQDWIQFIDETATRIVAEAAVSTTDPEEKDYAIGDLDRDCRTDLVVVRKVPFTVAGPRRNVLFMNENGVLTDRSATHAPAFLDATDDRDVQVADLDGDGWLDIVTAGTFGEAPRVLLNLGRDKSGVWLGFDYDPLRIPSFPIPPKFCSVAVGDVTGDFAPDLYFVNYEVNLSLPQLEDRLLINDGAGNFVDETTTRLTAAMVESLFGTSALIDDWNANGINDILKVNSSGPNSGDPNVAIFYNDSAGTGHFTVRDQIFDIAPYMAATADFTRDGRLDLLIVDDGQDRFLVNSGNTGDGRAMFSPGSVVAGGTTGFGGSARFADFNGDSIPDGIVADVDVDIPGFDRRLTILRGADSPAALTDPINAARPWRRQGTFDAVGMNLDEDGVLDLVVGSFDGMRVYRGTGQPLPAGIFANGFEYETTACWSVVEP
jgi:hypothetical protein